MRDFSKALAGLAVALMSVSCVSSGPTALEDTLARTDRTEADVQRDARSRPDLVLPLLALGPGARVADIFAGAGYYSDILSGVVGPDGTVLLHNNGAYRQFARAGLASRFDGRETGNIVMHDSEASDLLLGSSNLDAAIMIMSYHDLYYTDPDNGWPGIDAGHFLDQIFDALVPGGRFLVVDHAARAGTGSAPAQTAHRIDPAFAQKDIESHGFRLLTSTDALANPDDDHSLSVFDPAIRGNTDRFVYVFQKPR